MLESARLRFEGECADRIQQLDAREEAVRRAEGMAQRLQEQERTLQVRRRAFTHAPTAHRSARCVQDPAPCTRTAC
jgi:hypothetical protein